jgi:hypothetical protein
MKFKKTNEIVKIIGSSDKYIKRTVYVDATKQRFVKFNKKFWKYPQEVEY